VVCASRDVNDRKGFSVVDAPLDVYHEASMAHCATEHKYQRAGHRLLSLQAAERATEEDRDKETWR
jgi:hypothetical protein